MLKNNLYTLSDIIFEDGDLRTFVKLNPSHPIFEGHFPGNPILPGASIVQLIKDVLETHLNISLQLTKAQDIKFLASIIPSQGKLIQLQIKLTHTDELFHAAATIFEDDKLLAKFKGDFVNH